MQSYQLRTFLFLLFFLTINLSASTCENILDAPLSSSALWGICVVDQKTNECLYEHNSHKLFTPASITKLFTTAAVLGSLPPSHRFRTSIYANESSYSEGILKGDLILKGSGDPSLSIASLQQLAQQLYEKGLRHVKGYVIIDETAFMGPLLPTHAEWEDLTWYYAPEITALSIEDNTLQLKIEPNICSNQPAIVTIFQEVPYVQVINNVQTIEQSPAEKKDDNSKTNLVIDIRRDLTENVLTISGTMPLQSPASEAKIAIHHPSEYCRLCFLSQLEKLGIKFSIDDVLSINPIQKNIELAFIESPPLLFHLQKMNKESHNHTAELLIRAVGIQKAIEQNTTLESGLASMNAILVKMGLNEHEYQFFDGSGLSRHNLVSPRQVVTLLKKMETHPYREAFASSLPIAGQEGSLAQRYKGTKGEGMIRAKTGGMSGMINIAGYATTSSGKKVRFCILVNHYLGKHIEGIQQVDSFLLSLLQKY